MTKTKNLQMAKDIENVYVLRVIWFIYVCKIYTYTHYTVGVIALIFTPPNFSQFKKTILYYMFWALTYSLC